MLSRIIYFSIHNKLIVAILTLLLVIWGSYSFSRLPIDALPDITNNQVQVITVSPSNSAEDIEMMVTFPVEQSMSTIPGIEEVRSISRFGLSVVTIVFDEDVDVYWARQQVSERLTTVRNDLGPDMGWPELAPLTTGLGEIFQYVIRVDSAHRDQYSITDLRTIQDWIVRRQLLGVPGVADVSSFGGYLKQYEVSIDPDRLKSLGIDINDIHTSLSQNNENAGGSYINTNPKAYFIRSEGRLRSADDISNTVVKNDGQSIILVRDAASVRDGHAVRYGAMIYNDEGETVGAIVLMLKGSNSSEVIKNVKSRIEQIEKSLPEGVFIEPFLDRTKLVDNAIGTVATNLAEGALIVIFVLVVLLGNLRAGLIVASVIPLAMLFAVGMMNLFGVSGNLMSLGAIDFGLIVDGSLIVVEATMHHLGLRRIMSPLSQSEMDAEVYESASKIRNSAAFGEIIIMIVYLPLLVLIGIEGKMFKPMAQTVAFAILGAFLLSLFYVPAMSAKFLSKTPGQELMVSKKLMEFIHRLYDRALRITLKNKVLITSAAVVLFVVSLLIFSRLGSEFIPTLEEGDFAVETRMLTGTSVDKTADVARRASGILLANFPEVQHIVSKVGSSEIPVDPMPMEMADLIVVLDDPKDWTSASDRNELAEKMSAKLHDHFPGVSFGFQQPIQMRFNELITGARQDIVLKIYGEDLGQLSKYAQRLGTIASTVDGVEDLYMEQASGLSQIVISPDRSKLSRFGLNVDDVNRVIRASFAGEKAGIVYEGEKRFDLVVRLDERYRQSPSDISNIVVTAPNGVQIPLSQVASVEVRSVPNQIQREDAKRRIMVGFNVRGRDIESTVNDIRSAVEADVEFAPGYFVTYGGAFEQLQEASRRLMIAVPAALVLILVLLYFTFQSVKQGLLIFTAIPFSAIGGVLALWLRGMPFSISAGVGFIALFGVAVLNGIVLVAEFNRLKKEGLTDIYDIIFRGTATRLRPVILTAAVASLGFLPMALSHSSGAEVQKPLATVVIGGLVSATLLTLFVLPCLYVWFEKGFKVKPKLVAILILLGCSITSFGQNTKQVSPSEAVELALKNNRSIAASGYLLESKKASQRTSEDVGKTMVSGLFGQYNGFPKNDNNITISQSIPFPTVFGAKSQLNKAITESARLSDVNKRNEVKYLVLSMWHELNYLKSLQQRYEYLDSLYSIYTRASVVRQTSGESPMIERLTIEARAQKTKISLRENAAAIEKYSAHLMALTGSTDSLTTNSIPITIDVPDRIDPDTSPHVLSMRQQSVVASKETKLFKSMVLPDITLGYFNQTLIGVPLNNGGDIATASNRFQGFQVGLALPIFFRPEAARIKAAKFQQLAIEQSQRQQVSEFNAEVNSLLNEIKRHRESVDYYSATGLKQADAIYNQANHSFRIGDTGMIELMISLQAANDLYIGYLETLNRFNQTVLRYQYLTAQN